MPNKKTSDIRVDIIGQELNINDHVMRDGKVSKIVKFTPKMVKLEIIYRPGWARSGGTELAYCHECALLPKQEMIMWLLKRPQAK